MSGLTPNQLKAATLLASGKTARDVARAINCTPETISHWKRHFEFQALLNALRREALDAGRDALRSATRQAVEGLIELMTEAENEETRRKACIDVLEMNGYRNFGNSSFGSEIGPQNATDVKREFYRRVVEKQMFRGDVERAVE